jgi:hypothetical protein
LRVPGTAADDHRSAAMTAGVLAFLILIVAVLKALVDDYSGWAAWVGVALAAIIAVGAWMQIQEAGGIEHLKSQVPTSTGASAAGTTAAPAATASPAEPSAPAASPAAPAEPAPEAVEAAAESAPEGGDAESPERET